MKWCLAGPPGTRRRLLGHDRVRVGGPGPGAARNRVRSRDFGEVPTAQFFSGPGFLPGNLPNAALVVDTPRKHGAVVLVELLAQAQATPPASFTNASLFIDDCPDSTETCWTVGSNGFCGNMDDIALCGVPPSADEACARRLDAQCRSRAPGPVQRSAEGGQQHSWPASRSHDGLVIARLAGCAAGSQWRGPLLSPR